MPVYDAPTRPPKASTSDAHKVPLRMTLPQEDTFSLATGQSTSRTADVTHGFELFENVRQYLQRDILTAWEPAVIDHDRDRPGHSTFVTPIRDVSARQKPSERLFRTLAKEAPDELIQHLHNPEYSAGLRARAAEAAGDVQDSVFAQMLLRPLLRASDPIVQEAAIYGLERHLTEDLVENLRRLANDDKTSPGVREAAMDALDEWDERTE